MLTRSCPICGNVITFPLNICLSCLAKEWEEEKQRNRKYSKAHYERHKDEILYKKKCQYKECNWKKAGILSRKTNEFFTYVEYLEMLEEQDFRCRGCTCHIDETTRELEVDHTHSLPTGGGYARGIICKNCNLLLGHAKDDSTILRNLANYLDDYS